MERHSPDPNPAAAPAADAVAADLARLVLLSETLSAWVEEVEVGGADPFDLLPLCQVVREYAYGALLPALRSTIGPHLLATGVLASLPPEHGPGEDPELAGALAWLGSTADASEILLATKSLDRALSARVQREHVVIEAHRELREGDRVALARRMDHAHPEVSDGRGAVDRLLDQMDWPGRAA